MKKLKFVILFSVGALLAGCEADDKPVDELLATVQRGAILRTLNVGSVSFNVFDPESAFQVDLEYQDVEDGGLLSSVDAFVSFIDNTPGNGETSVPEAIAANFPASAFTSGVNGLPRISLSVTLAEALSALGIANDPMNVTGDDQIDVRLSINLTDGRTISSNDLGGTVAGGSFFSSPLRYRATVSCVPVDPIPGDYQLILRDDFGDGWDGAFITVTIDGASTDYTVDGAAGTSPVTFDINVPVGTTELIFFYTEGAFAEEHEAEIIAPTGNRAAYGFPFFEGEIVLSICL